MAVFEKARLKLQGIVLGQSLLAQIVNLKIRWSVEPIDGLYGIAGQAGPEYVSIVCVTPSADPYGCKYDLLPTQGSMKFDSADFFNNADQPGWEAFWIAICVHEMLHIFGIGSFWSNPGLAAGYRARTDCVSGVRGDYLFPAAKREWVALGGRDFVGAPPVEFNEGGAGTLCVHFDEATLNNELMTGFLDGQITGPGRDSLSRITLGALEDLNYVVDYSMAEPFTIPNPNGVFRKSEAQFSIQGRIIELPFVLGEGQSVEILDREGNLRGRAFKDGRVTRP